MIIYFVGHIFLYLSKDCNLSVSFVHWAESRHAGTYSLFDKKYFCKYYFCQCICNKDLIEHQYSRFRDLPLNKLKL